MNPVSQASTIASGAALAEASPSINAAIPTTDQPEDAELARHSGNALPTAGFALHELHPTVRELVFPAHGDFLLAQNTQQVDDRHSNASSFLYGGQQLPNAGPSQSVVASPPAVPGVPVNLDRIVAMNKDVQNLRFNPKGPLSEADLRTTQHSFQAATDALKKGDYKTAQHELQQLGFPLPPLSSRQAPSDQAYVTAYVLGAPAHRDGTSWSVKLQYGAHGNQAVNDLNGFTANARMINRMSSTPGGVSNPPTEAQVMKYMRDFAHPAQGPRPAAQQIMQAAGEITDGSIMHYSSAGARDPKYGLNPKERSFYSDRNGVRHEFDSLADARKAAHDGNPQIARGGRITTMTTRSHDEWSDISSQGTRAGRSIGDCESKLYLQTRLITEAGMTSIGSVDARPPNGGIGHVFGVFQGKDGSTWVTSNEEFRQVQGSGLKGAITQEDLDSTLRDMTADVYKILPNRAGVRDTSNFHFSSAATVNQLGPNAPTDTIRRATEMGMMRRSDTLIPPQPATTGPMEDSTPLRKP